MKFTKSLIASGVLAAASTASAKTTLDYEGRFFFQQNTYKVDQWPGVVDGDQKSAQGFKSDWLFLGLTTEWSGFTTNFSLSTDDTDGVGGGGVHVETAYVSKAYLGDKLTLSLGRQYTNMGGILINQYTTDNVTTGAAAFNLFSTFDGAVADYNFGMGSVALIAGSSPEVFAQTVSIDTDGDGTADIEGDEKSLSSASFMASPFIGLVVNGDFGPATAKLSYHSRSTGDYKLDDADTSYLNKEFAWLAFGVGYEANNVAAVLEYLSNEENDKAAEVKSTTTETSVKVAYTAGIYTPSLLYSMTENGTDADGDDPEKFSTIDLTIKAQADEGMTWFLSYATTSYSDDGDENDDTDAGDMDTSTIKLGVSFLGSEAL